MKDLYSVLLRNVDTVEYGANLQNIVQLGRKDQMSSKKLKVIINGDEMDPIECSTINIKIGAHNDVTIELTTETIPENVTEDLHKGFADLNNIDKAFLMGDSDLKSLTSLSPFRADKNQIKADINTIDGEIITVESGEYDIQDIESIQKVTEDLTQKEKVFIDEGFKIVAVDIPKYVFKNDDLFKWVEVATIMKIVDDRKDESDEFAS